MGTFFAFPVAKRGSGSQTHPGLFEATLCELERRGAGPQFSFTLSHGICAHVRDVPVWRRAVQDNA